jgi:perosamine synthetase|tara:strand:- start:614 stop:1726 length:1113 start_codon:yes stop_codon:yes gene_type:complete
MQVPLCKPSIDNNELKIITKSLKTPWLTHGPYNLKFEKLFSNKFAIPYSLSMNSCTSALECAIKCQDLKGEIIIPSFTWVSTANAILNAGCKPVFADIELNSRNIDPESIIKNITKKTVAIIVVHFSGLPCDMEKITKICKKYKLKLIEDSAETLGATYKNKYTGSFGLGCFSFFPTKNITTTEGGMLTFQDKKLFDNAKLIIAHGIDKKLKKNFWHRESSLAGHNYRLPNHLAALGFSQLKKLNLFNKKRRAIAKIYDKELSVFNNFFTVQKIPKNFTHSYQMYTVRVPQKHRSIFLDFMRKKKIEVSVHFDPPLHQQKYLKKYFKKKLPKTDIISKEIVTLPIFPDMEKKQLRYVIKNIKVFLSKLDL